MKNFHVLATFHWYSLVPQMATTAFVQFVCGKTILCRRMIMITRVVKIG